MEPRDLKPFFEVVDIQPQINESKTVAFKKARKLMFKHHPDKGGSREEFEKVDQSKEIIEFIYRPWNEYTAQEKRVFIECLSIDF